MTAATKKIIERLLKVGDWVEIDPHKHRSNYLIKGTAWRVEGFNSMKQTCQVFKEGRSETLSFEEVSDSSPYKKTDIVQLKSDPRYVGRVVNCRRNKITIEWAWGGVRESLDSDKIKLFVRMVRGEQILLGDYVFSEERIQEIKDKIIPPNPIFKTYYFRGRQHTVEWIYQKCNPPMSLQYFAQRLQRGWSLKKALETPTRKYQREDN